MKRDREWLKRVRTTAQEVLDATEKHFEVVCDEDNPRLQDVIEGMDISIQKLRCLLKDELAMPRTAKRVPAGKVAGPEANGGE
jgi:hypothetical protein